MKNVTLDVEGMGCEGCASTVESALSGVEGVRRADVSLDEKEARVTAEDEVTAEDLVAVVEEAGYGAAEKR